MALKEPRLTENTGDPSCADGQSILTWASQTRALRTYPPTASTWEVSRLLFERSRPSTYSCSSGQAFRVTHRLGSPDASREHTAVVATGIPWRPAAPLTCVDEGGRGKRQCTRLSPSEQRAGGCDGPWRWRGWAAVMRRRSPACWQSHPDLAPSTAHRWKHATLLLDDGGSRWVWWVDNHDGLLPARPSWVTTLGMGTGAQWKGSETAVMTTDQAGSFVQRRSGGWMPCNSAA